MSVQSKISFFAWEATWGKGLTLDMVQKRGRALANRCFMCLEKEETIGHLLLHCSKTRVLFGVSWVLPSSVREILLSWHGSFVGKNTRRCGELLLFTFFGRFERREIDWHSRMMCCQSRDWNTLLFFLFGLRLSCL